MKPTVLLAAIDGLSSAALEHTHCPNLHRLRHIGASTLQARSVMPSISLPCFLSVFQGVSPQAHGTLNNIYVPPNPPRIGLVEAAKASGKKSAFIHNWEPLRNLNQPLSLSFSYFIDNLYDGPEADLAILEQTTLQIKKSEWDFIFMYMGSLDVAGHKHGFMTQAYLDQLELIDQRIVGCLLDNLDENTFLLVMSDHGGHAHTHGTDSPEDMIVPWFVAGPGVRRGYEIRSKPSLLDIAPTLARTMGIAQPAEWEGHCLEEIFTSGGD